MLKDYAAARFDSVSQQRAMDVEGLDVAVLFRTLPVVCVDAFEPAFAIALCRAWNDWAADFRKPAPARMHAAALVTCTTRPWRRPSYAGPSRSSASWRPR